MEYPKCINALSLSRSRQPSRGHRTIPSFNRLNALGWTQEEIGESIGLSQPTISERLSDLAKLPKLIKSHIERGESVSDIAKRTGWRGLEPFANFLGVHVTTIGRHLPQKIQTRSKICRAEGTVCLHPASKKSSEGGKKIKGNPERGRNPPLR